MARRRSQALVLSPRDGLQLLLVVLLRRNGYEAIHFADPALAQREISRGWVPALVLVDDWPQGEGLTFARWIRQICLDYPALVLLSTTQPSDVDAFWIPLGSSIQREDIMTQLEAILKVLAH